MTAYANFGELKTAVQDWATRSDFPLGVYALASARISRKLRVREMMADYSATITTEAVALPDGYLEWDYVYIDADPRVVLTTGDGHEQAQAYRSSGTPTRYFVSGTSMYLNPNPSGSFDLVGKYFKRLDDFADDTDTNSVLTGFPEIYLAACLHFVFAWDQDAENEAKWLSHFGGLVEEANDADVMARYSGPLKMTARAHA